MTKTIKLISSQRKTVPLTQEGKTKEKVTELPNRRLLIMLLFQKQ